MLERPQQRLNQPGVQLALILLAATALRSVFFVGFGLGDDPTYIDYAALILGGRYPPLDPINQYAYRPLLLYLFAVGIGAFGYTDLGAVVPVLVASIVTTALVVLFVRTLVAPQAAWWCGLLFAFEPLNVIDSTTMTSDVVLSCLVFASSGLFLLADRERAASTRDRGFVAAGALLVAAFLVKITMAPALLAFGAYSLWRAAREPAVVRRHAAFYGTLACGFACICGIYYLKTGDVLWQFRSELSYYRAPGPPDPAGLLDYRELLLAYPRSLFGRSGYERFRYFEHGLLFWFFVAGAMWLRKRSRDAVTGFFIYSTVVIFLFFEFYPQQVTPHLVLLNRQSRHLELLVPGAAVVVGTALHRLSMTRRALAIGLLVAVLGHSTIEAMRRYTLYADSQRDVRDLARFAAATIVPAGRCLAVDEPAQRGLDFYLRGQPSRIKVIRSIEADDLGDCFVALGGARSFWWSHEYVVDVPDDEVPPGWRLAYRVERPLRPWRLSNLRVYDVPHK